MLLSEDVAVMRCLEPSTLTNRWLKKLDQIRFSFIVAGKRSEEEC